MPRKPAKANAYQQIPIDFEALIRSGQVLSRDEVIGKGKQEEASVEYSPIEQTAEYMQRAVKLEEGWQTTVQKARERLLVKDPRVLYLDFITDLRAQLEQGPPNSQRLAHLLEQVGTRGLGIRREHLWIEKPQAGRTRYRVVNFHVGEIERHIDQHIIGNAFLNPIALDDSAWGGRSPLIGSSDVSQHRSAVPVPARYFKRSVPFVLNNAAGVVFKLRDGMAKYENVFNPKPDEALLRWMLVDPSYQDELEPEDYQRCLASAMDVGQYKFDLEFLLKSDKHVPDIIFRDGSLFPQDAYLDNFLIENKRGEFTREAIRELLGCLLYAKEVGVVYCGVSKNVQLKVYSAVVDWFIARHIDKNWEFGNYVLNDGQAMTLLLSSPAFVGNNLRESVMTCLIRRSFTTRANLNTRADLSDLSAYFRNYESQHDLDVTAYKRLCDVAHAYMFFIGHSKSPQIQLPRYEFFDGGPDVPVQINAQKIMSGLQQCGFMNDEDHSFMADKPVSYLIPAVTQQAHILSKDVGKYIDSTTGQWIMARYRTMLPKSPGK